MGESESGVRVCFNGELFSVQVYAEGLAPASGWYELAKFDAPEDADWLMNMLRSGLVVIGDGEIVGDALSKARRAAHAAGITDGIAREKKRVEAERKAARP